MFDGEDDDGEPVWIPHPRLSDVEADVEDVDVELRVAPSSPKSLDFERVSGRGSRTEVNMFLEGAEDGLVSHVLGGVSSWKTAFVARYDGAIVSALVLHHYHPSTNGSEIAITRLANHPSAPANTSSWIISKARKWAERAGYDRIASYSGVGENEGVCYLAAGFERVSVEETEGKDWSGDDETWIRAKWVDELEPEKYADWSEQDATASLQATA